jgi:putative ubiquitin-RnfH superfamily antitoxin RatB of RatAB toxin-antitoxin module
MESETDDITIEVAYAKPQEQIILSLTLKQGISITEAIEQSGILQQFPEIDLKQNKVGIFSKVCKKDYMLRDKDRIEIYRPLIVDPKAKRKQRAAEGKTMRKGGAIPNNQN